MWTLKSVVIIKSSHRLQHSIIRRIIQNWNVSSGVKSEHSQKKFIDQCKEKNESMNGYVKHIE